MLSLWLVLVTFYASPFPRYSLHYLESKAEKLELKELPSDFEGFIFLGGCFSLLDTRINSKSPVYNAAGSRLFDFAILAKNHPNKPIVCTGTSAEAIHMKNELVRFGIDEKRITLENASRNTEDNASKTFELIKPKGKWVLVTSAFHIVRSVVLFERAGWNVIPQPVGYLTSNAPGPWWGGHTQAWYASSKEYLGLFKLGALNRLFEL